MKWRGSREGGIDTQRQ